MDNFYSLHIDIKRDLLFIYEVCNRNQIVQTETIPLADVKDHRLDIQPNATEITAHARSEERERIIKLIELFADGAKVGGHPAAELAARRLAEIIREAPDA